MKILYALKAATISTGRRHRARIAGSEEDFEVRFRRAFHREMTPDERKFFHLAERLLGAEEWEEQAGEMSCDGVGQQTMCATKG